MIHKLFIVAAGNTADHTSLRRELSQESNVAILSNRRREMGGTTEPGRRRRTDVDEQLRTRGWAVVRSRTSLNATGRES